MAKKTKAKGEAFKSAGSLGIGVALAQVTVSILNAAGVSVDDSITTPLGAVLGWGISQIEKRFG